MVQEKQAEKIARRRSSGSHSQSETKTSISKK